MTTVLVRLGSLTKAVEVVHSVSLGPGRQSAVVAANSSGSPPRHAAERRVNRLQRRIGGAHQALAEIVEAVPHVPDRVFGIMTRVPI